MDLLTSQDPRPASMRSWNEPAFESLVRSWSPALLRIAGAVLDERAGAGELVQRTWLRVVAEMDTFRPPPGMKAWVYRLLLAEARAGDLHGLAALHGPVVDPARFHPRDHARSPGHWSEPPQAWPRPDGTGRTGLDAATVVDRAVARLPQAERVVLSLRDVAGFEVNEICAVAGVSAAEARALLHRGRSVVRQALENHYADGRRPRDRETSQVLAGRNRHVRASRVRDDH